MWCNVGGWTPSFTGDFHSWTVNTVWNCVWSLSPSPSPPPPPPPHPPPHHTTPHHTTPHHTTPHPHTHHHHLPGAILLKADFLPWSVGSCTWHWQLIEVDDEVGGGTGSARRRRERRLRMHWRHGKLSLRMALAAAMHHSAQPRAQEGVEGSSVKNVSGKNGRGKGRRGSKGSGRLPTLVAAAERGKAEDTQELVMAHQVLKSVSSVVRMIIGRVIVQRWMMARRIRRNETLEPTQMVRGPATILSILVMKSVLQTCFRWIPCVVLRFLLSKTTMSVKLMLHFWSNLKVSVLWTAVQPLRLVALRALKPCSPRVTNMILEFQRLIHLVVDHSTLEMVLHQRLLPWPDSQVRDDALGDF